MGRRMLAATFVALTLAGGARAEGPSPDGRGPITVPVPLTPDGALDPAALVATLAARTGVNVPKPSSSLTLPMRGVAGALARRMLLDGLGPGATLEMHPDRLVVTVPPEAVAPGNLDAWRGRLVGMAERVRRAAAAERLTYGMKALSSYRPNDPARPTVLLVHGMNSDSSCFLHMVPPLEEAGFGIVVYDYPDNQDLDRSAPAFVRDVAAFRAAHGERAPWALVAHSMGALLARSHVEGDSFAGDVSSLILVGPPNRGSALAKAQGVLRLVEGIRATKGDRAGALGELAEGLGDAADDLRPGSTFLRSLDARPRRAGVRYHILAGDRGWLDEAQRRDVETRIDTTARAAGMFGTLARLAASDLPAQLDELTDGTGDGAVAVTSTRLDGAPAPVVIPANHVELIRGPFLYPEPGPVACMPQVLAWLRDDRAPAAE